jgi:hypothetical protein
VPDPERAPHGPQHITGVEVALMSPLKAADIIIIATEHVGRPREQLHILRAQAHHLVSRRESLISAEPRPSGVGLAAPLELRISTNHQPIIVARDRGALPAPSEARAPPGALRGHPEDDFANCSSEPARSRLRVSAALRRSDRRRRHSCPQAQGRRRPGRLHRLAVAGRDDRSSAAASACVDTADAVEMDDRRGRLRPS